MSFGITTDEPVSKCNHKGLLYALLGMVVLNLALTTCLGVGLIVVVTRGEPEAKRISGEIIAENIRALREFLDNEDQHEELLSQISKLVIKTSERNAPDVIRHLTESVAATLVPGDVFTIAQYLLEYNFTEIATLLSENLDVASRSFMKVPQYQSGAQVVSIISSVAGIVAEKVKPLGDNTTTPTEPMPSLLAELLVRIPAIIQASLDEQSWKDAALDCTILSDRLYFTNFVGTYETPYGRQGFDYNSELRPIFSQINQICGILAASENITSLA